MSDEIKFQFDTYQRHFQQPLRTSHGKWHIREGIIIRLINRAGKVVQGEIAPLPWFGSETIEQALEFCQQRKGSINPAEIKLISDHLPCCQFAFESAWFELEGYSSDCQIKNIDYCYLLPAGEQALTSWKYLYKTHLATTFKWKIGVDSLIVELDILKQLASMLPPKAKLRLDANGGLNLSQTKQLLSVTDTLKKIEFIEQPLPPNDLTDILQLSREYSTLLALDESVASFSQLQLAYQQGWQGVYVVKAAIMGFPQRLIHFCQDCGLDVVFSSVFETEVGRNAVLKMTRKLAHPRAVGFGVNHFF
jgi:o-succinylbenzoate synthase